MMSEWPMVKLGEVISRVDETEQILKPEDETFVTLKLHGKGVVPRNIGDGKTPKSFRGFRVKLGQFIYSRIDARNGAFGIIPAELDGAVVSKDFPVYEVDSAEIMPSILISICTSEHFVNQIRSMSNGATNRQRIKEDVLERMLIPLPPLGEQKRIAEILGRVAEAEQHVQDTLELLDEVAKSSFYTFCGIPDHFERRKKIGEIAIVATGNTPPRKDPSNYGSYIEWIKSDNLGSIFPTPASEFLSEEGLKRGRVAAPGSLLMTCIAGSIKSIGKCSVVNRKVAFNQQINSIKPVNNEDLYYLYLLFYVAPYLVQRRSTGGLKGIVKKSSLEMCEIPWPERKVRQMIGTFCQEWINCHLLVMRKLSLLQELQKSLANRAFAGLL